jgi:hypothetical protein
VGATEAGEHGTFVLVDGVKAGHQVTHDEPGEESEQTSKGDGHVLLGSVWD